MTLDELKFENRLADLMCLEGPYPSSMRALCGGEDVTSEQN